MDNNNLSEEEYLRNHLSSLENKEPTTNTQITDRTTNINTDNLSDLQYFPFEVNQFPCGIFYPPGTVIQVRAAKVAEIQSYSMVDDKNYYDIVEKMNDMLASCVRVKYSDGKVAPYTDLRDPDRYYLIFLIRELTFQKGSSLGVSVTCSCKSENNIELLRKNFQFYKVDDVLKEYYDVTNRCFTFETTNDKVFRLAPPTIGLQKGFIDYIVKVTSEKGKPNMSFLKIIPFLLYDRTSITYDGIKSKLDEYQKMDDTSFQFLNAAVEKLTFGIEKIASICGCGMEVHSDMIFPNGPSAIFVVHNAFEKFIKK